MKKPLFVLALIPALSMSQELTWSDASVAACFGGETTKFEVLEAINCVKGNPAAGTNIVEELRRRYATLAAEDSDVASALSALERQKNTKLYLKYKVGSTGSRLMVIDRAVLGGRQPTTVYDLSALDLRFTHTSANFGADKTVPLNQVRSFGFVARMPNLGELVTTLVDNTQLKDHAFQAAYPIKEYESSSKWRAISEVAGTSYPGPNTRDRLKLDLVSLSGYQITFLPEVEGRSLVSKFEAEALARQKAQEDSLRSAAEERRLADEREATRKAPLLTAMARARMGQEDSCRRVTDIYSRGDPLDADIDCQFSGRINLMDLKAVGWLVVNKQADGAGTVHDYYIRKAR